MRTDLDLLFQATAALVIQPRMSDDAAGKNLVLLLSSIAHFDDLVVFAYCSQERPVHVFSTFDAMEFDVFVSQYLVGPYLLDPFYRNALARNDGVWRMRELAPDRFFSSEYYRSYYSKTALAEEIGFFVTLESDIRLVVSLMRREATGAFSAAEFAQVKKAVPLVAAVCERFWAGIADRFAPERKYTPGRIRTESVWERLQIAYRLTAREAAIIELVLRGYSSESIGLSLGISTGTVKVHRRNVYRKLNISSQTQLFSLFFPVGEVKLPADPFLGQVGAIQT